MSRVDIPLRHHVLWSTGDLVIRAFVDLLLKDHFGNWHPKTFRVDSATDLTTAPAYHARLLGLPMPQQASRVVHTQTGLEVRSGVLRCRVVGLGPNEYTFPCFFLGDPDTVPNLNFKAARSPQYLLGLSGVIDKIRWTFDGTPAGPCAPHGYLSIEG